MTEQPLVLTVDTLISELAKDGYFVTKPKIQRWHRAGLVPPPSKRGLGRGFGTVNEYPPEALDAVKRVCDLQKTYRKLEDIAWLMWIAGDDIDPEQITKQLVSMVTSYQESLVTLFDANNQLNPDAEKQLRTQRLPSRSPLKPIVKRLGEEDFRAFMAEVAKLLSRGPSDSNTDLLSDGLTSPSGELIPGIAAMPLNNEFFSLVHDTLSLSEMLRAVDELGPEGLEVALGNFLAFKGVIEAFAALGGLLGFKGSYALEEWAMIVGRAIKDPEIQRFTFVLLVSMRAVLAKMGKESWIDSLGEQQAQLHPIIAVANAVACDPKVAKVLTPKRVETAFRSPKSQKQLNADLRRATKNSVIRPTG